MSEEIDVTTDATYQEIATALDAVRRQLDRMQTMRARVERDYVSRRPPDDVREFLLAHTTAKTITDRVRGADSRGAATKALNETAARVGADSAWVGKTIHVPVTVKDKSYTAVYKVVGFDTRKPVNCVIIENRRGKRSHTNVKRIRKWLEAEGTGSERGARYRRALDMGDA